MTSTIARADRVCRRVNRQHGVTYYVAAQLLDRTQRRHVHALYALCRRADDLVDTVELAQVRRERLAAFRSDFDAALDGHERSGGAPATDPVLAAAARTIVEFRLDRSLFDRFFAAMEADLSTTGYDTWPDLLGYMDGSAAVIGEMLLPILDPTDPAAALEPARHLGVAFQLTNFLRDIDVDLDLGRRYLPRDDLERFAVDLDRREVTSEFVDLMRFEIDRCRALYAAAGDGLAYLPVRSRRCVGTALVAYREILDRIERNGYDVFSQRATVPTGRKLRIAAGVYLRP
ncbi:MAG: phytoene synthase [Acidimicrobiaceae bacterium]|nr:phytoene synthase [Acidimicrobiaceae bacterium]